MYWLADAAALAFVGYTTAHANGCKFKQADEMGPNIRV